MNKYISLVLCFGILFFGSGCATTSTSKPETVDKVKLTASVITGSAQLGVYYTIHKVPESKAYFQTAVVVLTTILGDKDYSPDAIFTALQGIKVDELKTDEAYLAISAAYNVYKIYFAQQVSDNVDKEVYIKPVLVAFRDGISAGLNISVTEKTYNLKRK